MADKPRRGILKALMGAITGGAAAAAAVGARASGEGVAAPSARQLLTAEVDEATGAIVIRTADGAEIGISGADGSLTLKDAHGNRIETSPEGLSLVSSGAIAIRSQRTVDISGAEGVTIATPGDAKLSGMNTFVQGDIALTARGGASAELSAGGQTTINGAMVMIN